jgi:hypothetical protein
MRRQRRTYGRLGVSLALSVAAFATFAACGGGDETSGGSGTGDSGVDAHTDGSIGAPDGSEAGPDASDSGPDTSDSGPDASDSGPDASDSGPDTSDSGPDASDSGPDGSDAGPDASDAGPDGSDAGPDASDAGPDGSDAGPDASDAGPDASDAGPDANDAGPLVLNVVGATNVLALGSCGVTPATIALAAGSYTVTLESSTLSKGNVSGSPPVPSVDNYVIIQLPLPTGDAQSAKRFFMLNGIGTSSSFTLSAAGNLGAMFIDSDTTGNSGQATVRVQPGNLSAIVDATTNVIAWQTGCASTPASTGVTGATHTMTLTSSTLSAGGGEADDYVIVRLPSEMPQDDFRYVILNGVNASKVFTPFNLFTLRAWFISPAGVGSGVGTLSITPP